MNLKVCISLVLILSANIALSQVNTFPYVESFEQSFTTGTDVAFITNWTGNDVRTSSRLFQGTDGRTGTASVNVIPTSSFSGELLLSLDLSGINNPKLEFYAFSKQNGSSSSTRPAILNIATSIDGGSNFLDDVQIGDDTTFPNSDATSYTLYEYELPVAASGEANVVVQLTISRGDGSGSVAELVLDDLSIEEQLLVLDISSIAANSNTSVVVTFNQEVTQTTAEETANYSIDNGVTITTAERTAVNEVTLTTSTLTNNNYSLTVNNVEDAASNTPASNLQEAFSFIEPLSITGTNVIDQNTLEVLFNLDLDETSAETLANYSVDNELGNPITALLDADNSKKVTLTFNDDLIEASYTITVNGVQDNSTLATASDLEDTFSYLPLSISNIAANSATEIEVTFNQNLESTTANTTTNYALNFGFNTPTSAVLSGDNAAIVTLTFANPLVNNRYTLSVNQVANLSGNASADALSAEVTYTTATLTRQIVINEIFADPTGSNPPNPQVLPTGSSDEFIELYNASDNTINLADFDMTGGTIGDFALTPGAYVILTSSSSVADYEPFGDVVAVTSWNGLSNGGEQIILTDNIGNIVDSLTYDLTWYQDDTRSDGGWSLEQINPDLICSDANNWAVSRDVQGGSPGAENSLLDLTPDTTGPNAMTVAVNSTQEIVLGFNEIMDQSSLMNGTYTLDNGISITNVSPVVPGLRSVTLSLSTSMTSGTIYTLTTTGVIDCAGNAIDNNELSFLFDNEAPVFERFVFKDNQTVDLIFDEDLNEVIAETESNFSIDQGIGAPGRALLNTVQPNRLSLELDESLTIGTTYNLTLQNLTDTLGNVISQSMSDFIFSNAIDTIIVVSSQLLDVYFSEDIQTASAQDIGNYEVSNEIGNPKTALQDDDNPRLVHLIFESAFDDNRDLSISFEDITDSEANFLQLLNTVFVYDTDRPGIDTVQALDANTVLVTFDEALNLTSAEAVNNYSVNNDIGTPLTATLQADGLSVQLVFEQALENEIENTISIRGIQDLAMNEITSTRNIDFTYDVLAPSLTQLKVLSPTQLELTFSEDLDEATAQALMNYSIDNGIGNPILAELSIRNPNIITLTFNSLGNNPSNEISISGLEDLNGNILQTVITDQFVTNEVDIALINVLTDSTIQVQFTKELDALTAEDLTIYSFTEGLTVNTVLQDDAERHILTITLFEKLIENTAYELDILSMEDTDGNVSVNLNQSFSYDSQVAEIMIINENTIRLIFENKLETITSQTNSNYILDNGIGSPLSAVLNNEDELSVTLIFSTDLIEGLDYTLAIQNLKDSFEDQIPDSQQTLVYDITAASVTSVESTFTNQITVNFDESLDQVTAETLNHYSLDNGVGIPLTATLSENGNAVLLTFNNDLIDETTYALTIDRIEDLNGNAVNSAITNFLFEAPINPAFRELVINEIYPDPDPDALLPNAEFIEIFNSGSEIIKLQDFTISDNNSTASLTAYDLEAGSYLILSSSSNASLFSEFGPVMGLSNFPSLSNTGETIFLKRRDDQIIDSLQYSQEHYNDVAKQDGGYSIELINPTAPCFDISNYAASTSSNQGTPGLENSVFDNTPDAIAPELSSLEVISDQQLKVTFNESMDIGSITATDFSISDDVTISDIEIVDEFGTEVLINLTSAFERGIELTLTISELTDCAGNSIIETNNTFFLGAVPTANQIVITEIMANPTPSQGLPEVEYIEIYNTSDKILTLEGLMLSDRTGGADLPSDTFSSGEYLLLTSSANADEFSGITVAGVSGFPSLNTSGDSLAISDSNDNLIFDVVYTDDFYQDETKAAGGFSLEMINPEAICFDNANWTATNNSSGGTPGLQNSVFDNTPDIIAPELSSLEVISDQQLKVTFNESMDIGSITATDFSVSDGVTISDIEIVDEFGTEVLINLTSAFERGIEFTLTISDLSDCSDNTIVTTDNTFFLGAVPITNDIIITEIMANPDPSQGLPEVEYIEIYNASNKILSLDGLSFSDRTGGADLPSVSFSSGEYLLLTSSANADEFTGITVAGVSGFPSLNTSGDSLAISDSDDNLIFDVVYTDDFYLDETKAAGGFSLEMINPEAICFDNANWTATNNSSGGTPGLQNSVFDNAPDAIAPELSSLEVISDQQLKVTFNESMDVGSITATDFSISDGVTISDIEILDEFGTEVLINLTSAFERGTELTLTISNLTDCAANSIVATSSALFLGAVPTANDIIITEIMANPDPSQGLPEVEYIEIYNASNKILSLDGLSLSDRTGGANLPSTTFNSGEYLLLTSSANADEFTGITVTGVSGFPSLNTSGDSLAISDTNDNLIFHVVYTDDFYQDETKAAGGFSLEMINPEANCFDNANWTATNNSSGGTPGLQNSVFDNAPDAIAPELSSLEVISDQQLKVTFNESMDVGSITNTDFTISDDVTIAGIEILDEFGTEVLINLSSAVERGIELTLTISELTDCAGNTIITTNSTFFLGAVPTTNDIIITEIMANPDPSQGLPEVEYIEIYNASGKILTLEGLMFSDRTGGADLPSTTFNSGEYLLLTSSANADEFSGITVAGVSGFPSLNTSGDSLAISDSDDNLIFDVVYTDDFYQDETKAAGGFSLEMINPEANCFDNANWTATNNSTGGTPGLQNSVFDNAPDAIAPELSSLEVISDQQLKVTFNESMDLGSITATDFSISNGVMISDIEIIDEFGTEILINLASAFERGTELTLTISELTDCAGNSIIETNNTFFLGAVPTANQIIITEIMANPDPSQGLPEVEYIEIYNASDKILTLESLMLSDRTGGADLPSTTFNSGEYLLLTSSANADEFSGISVVGVSGFPSLNTSGDSLAISDSDDNLIFDVVYTDDFYEDETKAAGGFSLEMINPEANCFDNANWTATNNSFGGTPGLQNSVFDNTPDAIAPELSSLEVISNQQLKVTFNESMDIGSITATDFSISDGITISDIEILDEFGTEVLINLASAFERGTELTLTISDLTDCAGNSIVATNSTFFLGAVPTPNEIIITEIMANPAPSQGLPEVEYIEILNVSGRILSLQGLSLSDRTSLTQLPAVNIAPGAYTILTTNNGAPQFSNAVAVSGFPSLNTSGDDISISLNGEEIFGVNYTNSWYRDSDKAAGGFSLEMIDTAFPCQEASNWRATDSNSGGTPGQINSVIASNPDITGPKLISAVALTDQSILLTYDERLETATINNSSFSLSNGIIVTDYTISQSRKEITITTDTPLQPNILYTITSDNVTDCSGNLITSGFESATVVIAVSAQPADILINEILFNPRSGGVRFVELYNNSDNFINLKNWLLAGATSDREISTDEVIIDPGTYFIITTDLSILASQYPQAQLENSIEMTSLPSLPNTEGTVTLISENDVIIDLFDYSDDFHSSLLDDVDGVSLERIRFNATTNDPNNWQSASSTEGFATPGYTNSQSQQQPSQGMTVNIEPKTFAPDVAGMAAFTTINFEFDNPGNTLNVKIYDTGGNLVNEIAQNALVGSNGFFRWDGTYQNGSKARVGYYMIFFEIISPDGIVSMMKERVAIGTRF